jgi:hypothetical protein
VPAGDVCADNPCTEGVTCAEVVAVANDADLATKLAAATSGTCLALAPGQYGLINLPGGVSLLGRSAASVKLGGVIVGAGSGAVLRGIGVGSSGVELLGGASGVRIESVRTTGDPKVSRDGVTLHPGTSATVVTSTLDGAGRMGIFAEDADVTLDRTVVSGAHVAGIWIQGSSCDATCTCQARPTLTANSSIIRDNHRLGLSARGTVVNLSCTDVTGTQVGDTYEFGQRGGGVTAAECSDVSATKLRVLDSADWGVLIDGSIAKLGSEKSPDDTVEISRNKRGLWVQNVVESVVQGTGCMDVGGCVALHNGTLMENRGVGIGVAGETRGMIICKATVMNTFSVNLPVSDEMGKLGFLKAVGDGLNWLDGSEVVIEALTLADNERQSLLIDGPASGNIMSMSLSGSDVTNAPLQQNLAMGDAQPTLGSGVSLASQETRKFAVPLPLALPPM